MNAILKVSLSAAVSIAAFSAFSARAADFYAGKTISILVPSDVGGGYDIYTRLLARHLPKYIPGKPTIIVQNEPGAGGLRASQLIYSVLAKDGTKIANLRATNMLDSILNIRGGEIDPTKFEWLGNMASDTDVCSFSRESGVKSLEDLKVKPITIGASAKGSQGFSFANAMNVVLHTQMKIIIGYKGAADRLLAMQQGELQGNCGMNITTILNLAPQLLENGDLIIIVQSGMHPHPLLPKVPLTQSFGATERERAILTTIYSQMEIARVFAAPPGTPKDRVRILREAIMKSMQDPSLVDEAKRLKLDLDPMSGEEAARIVSEMAGLTHDLKADVRNALGE